MCPWLLPSHFPKRCFLSTTHLISQFWRFTPEMRLTWVNTTVSIPCGDCGRLGGGESASLPLPAVRGYPHFLAPGPFLSSTWAMAGPVSLPSPQTGTLAPFKQSRIICCLIPGLNSLCNCHSSLPLIATYSRVLESRMYTYVGVHYSGCNTCLIWGSLLKKKGHKSYHGGLYNKYSYFILFFNYSWHSLFFILVIGVQHSACVKVFIFLTWQ